MIKKILFLVALASVISINYTLASTIDTSFIEGISAFEWKPISDVDKTMQYEKQKNLTKRSIDQAKLAAGHYTLAIESMKKQEYIAALKEFQAAMKRYKRAKLSADAMNFIHTNMALSYASSGNKQDQTQAKRLLNLLTPKAYNDEAWAYNIAIANYLVGNQNQSASLLSNIIRKNQFNFQAYITLEAIYRNSGNIDEAERVNKRMNTAELKLKKKTNKTISNSSKIKAEREKAKNKLTIRGKKPDITNLKIVKNDNHLQFDKVEKIDERSMVQIQEGINDYEKGVNVLSRRDHKTAQSHLKNSEKKLKRGKINDNGLNFVRANLAISYLATKEKRGVGQAKRYLKSLSSELYNSREWTYNMAVAFYQFAYMSARENKKEGTRKWTSPTAAENLKKSIKLFQKSIKQDKLFLPAYENLIYIYKEQSENKKAENIGDALKKARKKLMQSFTKEEQQAKGGSAYIFRINLGTFGSFDTPAHLFDEPNVIAIPITEGTTAYISGLFYSSDEAIEYQKNMKKKGYINSFIVAYKDGQAFTDF